MSRHDWDRAYDPPSGQLGWFEPVPSTLGFVSAHSTPQDPVIDVGGGDSRLVDELLDLGYSDVTVLDLSAVALRRSRERLGERAGPVCWITADVTTFEPTRTWQLWHDRATFHFLVEPGRRAAYLHVAGRSVASGGRLVIATFAPDGPDRCAGLPVCRWDAEGLAAEFGAAFTMVDSGRIEPAGPVGDQRPYVVAVLERH